jgi:hypothetical protein
MTKASDNPFPSLLVQEAANDGSDFGNPSADYRRLFLGEDGALHLKDSAGTVTAVGGSVAADAIWDAAGDLAVGSGANTAARLAAGAAGGVLAMGNGAVIWNAGTSFPASKATGDRYWRTDLGMEFFWDGTQWVTTTLFTACTDSIAVDFSATGARFIGIRPLFGLPILVVEMTLSAYVATTNDGSKYWRADLERTASAVSWTTVSQPSTAAQAASAYVITTTTPGTAVAVADGQHWRVNFVKVSTPGNITADVVVTWRLIAT